MSYHVDLQFDHNYNIQLQASQSVPSSDFVLPGMQVLLSITALATVFLGQGSFWERQCWTPASSKWWIQIRLLKHVTCKSISGVDCTCTYQLKLTSAKKICCLFSAVKTPLQQYLNLIMYVSLLNLSNKHSLRTHLLQKPARPCNTTHLQALC